MLSHHILQFINSGIAHIARDQLPNGGFRSFSDSDPENLSAGIELETTFFAANVLACLASAGLSYEPTARRAAVFLIEQMSEQGSFNYWSYAAPERMTMPYPDDLDDTFGAFAALAHYDPALIDGKVLASVAKILPAAEVQAGGPYRTWLMAPEANSAWKDVDVVVNSAVGYFLSLVNVRLPKVEHFIDEAIKKDQLTSPYYPGTIQVIYFISRFYKAAGTTKLADLLLDFLPANSLEHAMAITALINLGYGDQVTLQSVDHFMANLDWQPYAFCTDPVRGGKKYYAGSSALTAAFCIEALAKYAALPRASDLSPPMSGSIGSEGFHERIYAELDVIIPGSRDLFADIMDTIDGANAWEQAYCRLPFKEKPEALFGSYDNLADRSIGHALPVLIELLALGYAVDSKAHKNMLVFFRHYLIARQLHDDAHDWAEDLVRGQLNSVGALVIAEFMKSDFAGSGNHENSWSDLIPRLRIFFWRRVIDGVTDMICSHIAEARFVREQGEPLGDNGGERFMEQTLAGLECSAWRTLEDRDGMLAFLAEYERSSSLEFFNPLLVGCFGADLSAPPQI